MIESLDSPDIALARIAPELCSTTLDSCSYVVSFSRSVSHSVLTEAQ